MADWIIRLATNEHTPFLIFDQIEPLIATFGRSNSIEFFKLASLIEPKIPTIIFTYLEKQIKDANFPSDRLLNLYQH
ncbi:MAG: hypothetical protein CL608_26225 [Anaerolineaceae bacterium]|nr:hypothetical protein [Anaerolineaceae bacterium]